MGLKKMCVIFAPFSPKKIFFNKSTAALGSFLRIFGGYLGFRRDRFIIQLMGFEQFFSFLTGMKFMAFYVCP
jgi:hypothetical protein